jgi:hypothetical protein
MGGERLYHELSVSPALNPRRGGGEVGFVLGVELFGRDDVGVGYSESVSLVGVGIPVGVGILVGVGHVRISVSIPICIRVGIGIGIRIGIRIRIASGVSRGILTLDGRLLFAGIIDSVRIRRLLLHVREEQRQTADARKLYSLLFDH